MVSTQIAYELEFGVKSEIYDIYHAMEAQSPDIIIDNFFPLPFKTTTFRRLIVNPHLLSSFPKCERAFLIASNTGGDFLNFSRRMKLLQGALIMSSMMAYLCLAGLLSNYESIAPQETWFAFVIYVPILIINFYLLRPLSYFQIDRELADSVFGRELAIRALVLYQSHFEVGNNDWQRITDRIAQLRAQPKV